MPVTTTLPRQAADQLDGTVEALVETFAHRLKSGDLDGEHAAGALQRVAVRRSARTRRAVSPYEAGVIDAHQPRRAAPAARREDRNWARR
jgi:hypothetical protein